MGTQEHKELNEVVKIINQTVQADKIYLFGSFARDEANADSDFDIYVVLSQSEIRPIKAIQKINYALSHVDMRPIDILAGHTKTFLESAQGPTLERTILEQGVSLYERQGYTSQAMA